MSDLNSKDGSKLAVIDSLNHIYILETSSLRVIRKQPDAHG